MLRRKLLMGFGAIALWPRTPYATPERQVEVCLDTAVGSISLTLDMERAPITAGNFIDYVVQKRYDGASFYRAYRKTQMPTTGLIQGGILPDSVQVLPPIRHESTLQTGLSHRDGTVSMARYAPGTATCHFFICIGDMSFLDAHSDESGDNLGFAAFGRISEGMDVVRKILVLPTSPTAGEGAMRGQMLEPSVPIRSARVTS